VLNVVPEAHNRVGHALLARRILKPGGIALFKVWAGCWPERGTAVPVDDTERGCHQRCAWASELLPEVESAFGRGNVFADNMANLVVARRP
jgi:hypothetical protein